MAAYKVGQRIEAAYETSVYKSGVSGWRSETVNAVLEVISAGRARVVSASMERAGSNRQQYNVRSAENSESGKMKNISSLRSVQIVGVE